MNEKLTDEVLEEMVNCDGECIGCPAQSVCDTVGIKRSLATALLEERAKQKDDVWKYAPDGITTAEVHYGDDMIVSATPDHTFTRELPKTRARQIAENVVHGINGKTRGETKDVEYVEGVLNKYAEELKGEA